MKLKEIEDRLSNIENLLIGTKEVLTFDEVATYTGLSRSYLYKLTSTGQISHFKPKGKMLYFNKRDVDSFLQQNRVSCETELEPKAIHYVTLKTKGKHD
jgi:excisionase family DNA binding protein